MRRTIPNGSALYALDAHTVPHNLPLVYSPATFYHPPFIHYASAFCCSLNTHISTFQASSCLRSFVLAVHLPGRLFTWPLIGRFFSSHSSSLKDHLLYPTRPQPPVSSHPLTWLSFSLYHCALSRIRLFICLFIVSLPVKVETSRAQELCLCCSLFLRNTQQGLSAYVWNTGMSTPRTQSLSIVPFQSRQQDL